MEWVIFIASLGASAIGYACGRLDGLRQGYTRGWDACKGSHSYSGWGDYLLRRTTGGHQGCQGCAFCDEGDR